MDASTFRWVLIIIAVILAVAIYLYGMHQTRLRKRNAIETFTREEVDSAFVEDEQLRFEMNNLNKILTENETDETDENLEEFLINPGEEAQETPSALPDPEIYIPPEFAGKNEDRLISHHLRHSDFRLIVGEEAESAVQQADLQLNAEGLLEYREEEELSFQIASLSEPGNFHEIEDLNFATLGFNCFIDLDSCENPRLAYESMLKKIDELVRMLNVKVYKPDHELLTISDVTSIREKLV
jgi:FtsZ-interacting cell division protein ZipA